MKKPALILAGVLTVMAIAMLYTALSKTKTPLTEPLPNIIKTTKISEFTSKTPKETWEKFSHSKYKYSFLYPPEFSLSEPVSSQGEILDIVRLFYNKKTAVGVFKVVSKQIKQQEKYEGKDADSNQVITYKFPLGKNTLVFQATVFTQMEGKTKFDQVIEQIAGTVQIEAPASLGLWKSEQ